jgi:hypothetical protein
MSGAMAPITATFVTDPKLILRSYRASHRGAYVFRWVASVALVVAGIVTRSVEVAVLGLALFVIAEISVRRQLRPYLGGQRSVTVTMTEQEYKTRGPDRATARTWSTFSGVRRVGEFWVLRISTAAAMALPISALDAEQTRAFEDLLRRKGLLRS